MLDRASDSAGRPSFSQPPNSVEDRQRGNRATRQQAGRHADDQRWIALIETVNDSDYLKNAKASEGDERYSFVALLAPHGDDLGDEQQGVPKQAKTENDCDDLFH